MSCIDRTTPIGQMINSYLSGQSEQEDHVIHLLFSANRWEAAYAMALLLIYKMRTQSLTKLQAFNTIRPRSRNHNNYRSLLLQRLRLQRCQAEPQYDPRMVPKT
jgi:hypothetical protein